MVNSSISVKIPQIASDVGIAQKIRVEIVRRRLIGMKKFVKYRKLFTYNSCYKYYMYVLEDFSFPISAIDDHWYEIE